MKKDKEKQNPLLLLLVLLILLLVIYGLYLLFFALFQNTLTDNFIKIIGIFVIVAVLAGMVDSINKKTLKKLKQSEPKAEAPVEREHLKNESNDLEAKLDAKLDALVPKQTAKNKNRWTSIPAVIVFFGCLFWMFRILSPDLNFLSFIGGGDITGRWINDTQIVETGMQSYTEYWYMDIYDDGTLDIGWKNEGYSEDSQGWGTWEEEGSYYYVVIYYDYGSTISAYLDIEGSKLIDASSKTDTGYRRG